MKNNFQSDGLPFIVLVVTKVFLDITRSSFDPVMRLYYYKATVAQERYSTPPKKLQPGIAIVIGEEAAFMNCLRWLGFCSLDWFGGDLMRGGSRIGSKSEGTELWRLFS